MIFMQVLVGHATEGTDAAAARLIDEARTTTSIANIVSTRRITLRRRPIAGGGE